MVCLPKHSKHSLETLEQKRQTLDAEERAKIEEIRKNYSRAKSILSERLAGVLITDL